MKIALLVGSLRKQSWNRKVAHEFIRLSPDEMKMELLEIKDLPHYNEDLDSQEGPSPWDEFRSKLHSYDGFIFFTPEYNRSISGVLKNALDVGSQPYGKNGWNNKPAAVVSATMGALGGYAANHILRQSLVVLNLYAMAQPECYLGKVHQLFEADGSLKKDPEAFFQKVIDAFYQWCQKFT